MRARPTAAIAPMLAGVLVLAACAVGPGGPVRWSPSPETPAIPISTTAPSPVPTVVVATPGRGGLDQEMVDEVVRRAAADAGVEVVEVTVLVAEAVTWSDGSIGCPQEGMTYTQALVPGYRVVLEIDGREVHYHAGRDQAFFRCDDPRPPVGDGRVNR